MSKLFAIADVLPGHLNAMVKNLMRQMGVEDANEAVRRFNAGELKLVPRDPVAGLLQQLGDPIEFPAVPRFVAREAFTAANGIAWMQDDFKEHVLPLVEENVAAATLTISELSRDAKDLRISAELNMDEDGEVALAHFFHALQVRPSGIRTDNMRSNATYIIGTDGDTWIVSACLRSDGWIVFAGRLGDRLRWNSGTRFLSR